MFEIEFGFYSGRNSRSFWKCGGCMRVCVNRNRGRYCFVFSKGQILNDIRGHSDPKIYARLQEIASNFLKFFGETPAGPRAFSVWFGASPPYRAPFPKFLDPPLQWKNFEDRSDNTRKHYNRSPSGSCFRGSQCCACLYLPYIHFLSSHLIILVWNFWTKLRNVITPQHMENGHYSL